VCVHKHMPVCTYLNGIPVILTTVLYFSVILYCTIHRSSQRT